MVKSSLPTPLNPFPTTYLWQGGSLSAFHSSPPRITWLCFLNSLSVVLGLSLSGAFFSSRLNKSYFLISCFLQSLTILASFQWIHLIFLQFFMLQPARLSAFIYSKVPSWLIFSKTSTRALLSLTTELLTRCSRPSGTDGKGSVHAGLDLSLLNVVRFFMLYLSV